MVRRSKGRARRLVNSKTRRVFLSASVPLPSRDQFYFNTADVIAIRDAVRALTIVLIEQKIQLVFGGHPAITPMVRLQINQAGYSVGERVTLYQSKFWRDSFPEDNKAFESVVLTDAIDGDKSKSLAYMREEMLRGPFICGLFIGGMEGVEEEYNLFRKQNLGVPAYPIASTGAASAKIYDAEPELQLHLPQLMTEISYISLMRSLIQLATVS